MLTVALKKVRDIFLFCCDTGCAIRTYYSCTGQSGTATGWLGLRAAASATYNPHHDQYLPSLGNLYPFE